MSFSPKQFRQSIQQSNKIAQKFQKYLAQCKKNNIEIIYHMTEEFMKIINDKQPLLLKVNSVFALTLCIQTTEYAIIEMIEAFLLPILQEIALYQSDKRNYSKTSQYFKDKGYPQSTPNIDQLSHNYVTMVTNLVFLAGIAKENYYFFTDKLNLPSAFKQLSNKLVQKGNQIPQNIIEQGVDLQQTYQNNLFQFQNYEAQYVQFFKKRVSNFIIQGGRGKESLDIRKILKNNDSWLTSQIIGSLHDALEDDNFQVRRNSLTLLNELFIWGDVEAIMIVNEGQSIEHIYEKILQAKGGFDLGRGAYIFPQIKGPPQHKKSFYVDYLRCIQTWAKLVPTAIYLNREEDSKTLKLYNQLKDSNIIFPNNDIFNKYSKEFEENMKKNQERNNYIITQLNDGDTSKNRSVASNRLSKYSQKISLIKQMRESTILSLSEIERMIQQTQVALKVLPKSERQISKHMKTLKYFSQQFQKKFCLIQESVTEEHLQLLYERGSKCNEKIGEIQPVYSDYINGKIDFKKFGEMLQNKFSQIQTNKSKSKFSDVLSKLSKSKNSISKDGLQLSKSLHNVKVKEQYSKHDHILEKSVDEKSHVLHAHNNFNKSGANMSKLSEKSSKSKEVFENKRDEYFSEQISLNKKAEKSKVQKGNAQKNISKLSKQDHVKNSMSFSRQQSIRSTEKQKNPTAKFILDIQPYKKESEISNQSSLASKEKKSSNGSVRANYYNKNTPQYQKPPVKKKEQFSDNSEWSSSGQQAPKANESHHSKVQKSNPSNFKQQSIKNKALQSKSREVFSDSSFSQYDESNEQIREAIDKSENPDFKMLFKDKTFDNNPSHQSKMSKASKLQSHDHYTAVLESLVPKGSQNQAEKQLSRISKDKSTSQLPPKSNYDHQSKIIDNQKNYQLPSEYEYSKEDSSSIREKMPNKTIVIKSKDNSQAEQQGSKNSNQKSVKGNISNSNSMYPPDKQQKSSISKLSSRQQQLISPPSSLVNQQYQLPLKENPQRSKMSSISGESNYDRSSNRSKLSKIHSEDRFKKKPSRQSQQNSIHPHEIIEKGSDAKIQTIKEQRLNEIRQLQRRIQTLKNQQKHLYTIRSDWQSPTRPNSLRTALSPRFRNNNTTNQSNPSNPSNPSNQTYQTQYLESNQNEFYREKRHIQRQRNQQMNFDVIDLFKPPEGRLIYSRLYKKQLSQLNIRERRKILKGKDLVFRNEDLQIGLMIHRDLKDLKIIYYITACRFIKTFLFKVEPSNKLSVHAIPNQISNLQPRKQYRIYLFAEVLQFPFKMPQIQFKYHPQLMDIQQKLFINNEVNYFTSIIPFYFTKFMIMRSTTLEQIQQAWAIGVLRGEQTAYSKKLLPKHFYILQYFPDMVNIESKQYENWYGVECEYGSTKFLLKVVIKINKFMYIQGVLTSFRDKSNSERIMEYTICCINELLSKTHKDIIT